SGLEGLYQHTLTHTPTLTHTFGRSPTLPHKNNHAAIAMMAASFVVVAIATAPLFQRPAS
ncbi:hypothetical protein, partial [Nocardia abscessus]|uniref:hypothetical protein n=1 Tax=Nocardia abscessus TaxID=120957 RepID=UPI0024549BE7